MKTALQTRFASFAFAAVMTIAILAGVDGLATAEPQPQLAQQHSSQTAA
jgi:hypothetical protein